MTFINLVVTGIIITCDSISWSCKSCWVPMGKRSASGRDFSWPLMGEIVALGRGSLENRFNYWFSTKSSLSFSVTTNFRGDTTSLGAPVSVASLTRTYLVDDTSPRGLLSSIYRLNKSCRTHKFRKLPYNINICTLWGSSSLTLFNIGLLL